MKVKIEISEKLFNCDGTEMTKEQISNFREDYKQRDEELKREKKEIDKQIQSLKSSVVITDWLKNYIDTIDLTYKDYKDDLIEEMYFQQMVDFQENIKDKNYKNAYATSQASLSLIRRFIEIQYLHYNGFYIKSMPLIEFNLKYNSIMGLSGALKNVSDIIGGHAELIYLFSDKLNKYIEMSTVAKEVRKIIKNNPNILQNSIKNILTNTDAKIITESIKRMEEYGIINRIKKEKTYELTLNYESSVNTQ